jgi:hypothetical protein
LTLDQRLTIDDFLGKKAKANCYLFIWSTSDSRLGEARDRQIGHSGFNYSMVAKATCVDEIC